MTTLRGDSYIGQFKDGKKHGKGKLVMKNGVEYEGRFENGKIQGRGKLKR